MNPEKAELKERVILVAVTDSDGMPPSVEELKELVKTAGAEVAAVLVQHRSAMHPRTYLGTGKLLELEQMISLTDATGIICDDELTPSQIRSMEEVLHTKIMDRTLVILDIFAAHATSGEGKLQVELAQLRHQLTQLTGIGRDLSRLGGGIGTRGPGEKKLETDRRLIGRRISHLKRELKDLQQHRDLTRAQRMESEIPIAAIVGYTNAGKSSLLNCLTDSDIPANDRLFDTLDTTTRRLRIDETQEVLLSDTVGFIRKLPTHLIEAFKATLEELSYADVLLHVIDISNPEWEEQARIVDELVRQLGAEQTPCLRIFNKCDRYFGILPHGENVICISARTGEGTDALIRKLSEMLDLGRKHVRLVIPYSEAGIMDRLNREAVLKKQEYTESGIEVEAIVTPEIFGRVKQFIPDYEEPREEWEQ